MYALAAALATAFVACPSRYLGLVKWLHGVGVWKPVLAVSFEYLTIVLVAAACGAIASYGPRPQWREMGISRTFLPAVSLAVWCAPLMILLLQRSALAGILAAGLVVVAFSQFGFPSQASEQVENSHADDSRVFLNLLALSIVSSGVLQAAVVADWIAERALALMLFLLGAALLAARLASRTDRHADIKSRLPSWKSAGLNIGMAIVVCAVALLPLLMPVGGGSSVDALFHTWIDNSPPARERPVKVERASVSGDGYVGVILTPREQKQKQVIVPPELSLANSIGPMRPLTIHFTGSYWFFQSPFLKPPYDSIHADGDPISIGVHTLNHRPLMMEAMQRLDEPVDATRLSTIEVVLTAADSHPTTVAVQLVLTNTRLWSNDEQSLGLQQLSAELAGRGSGAARSETLAFEIPQRPRCKEFNQLLLVFWLDRSRDQQAAAIAIEDFVLVPKRA